MANLEKNWSKLSKKSIPKYISVYVAHYHQYFKTTSQNLVGGHLDLQQSVSGVVTRFGEKASKSSCIKASKPDKQNMSLAARLTKTRFSRVNSVLLRYCIEVFETLNEIAS